MLANSDLLPRNQKDTRRQKHLTALKSFEIALKKFNKQIESEKDQVKKEIISFFGESEVEILKYFDTLDDETLLHREADFVIELKDLIQ